MKIILNGRLAAEDDGVIPVTDRGFTLGDGVFDTMLAVDGEPYHAARHFSRLLRHAAVLGIPCPHDVDALDRMARELLAANKNAGRAALRTTLTRGAGAHGLAPPDNPAPTLVMRLSPAPEIKPEITAIISQATRRNEYSPLSRIKSLNYGDNILAAAEARDMGADDAILLNTSGHVCCATVANILAVQGDQIFTPPLADGVLDGVMRGIFIDAGLVKEKSLTPEEMIAADGVYTINSLRGAQIVVKINGRELSRPSHTINKKILSAADMADSNRKSGGVLAPDRLKTAR